MKDVRVAIAVCGAGGDGSSRLSVSWVCVRWRCEGLGVPQPREVLPSSCPPLRAAELG